jgi:RNA polymerase sigma-70 factor (ECF subfamily)
MDKKDLEKLMSRLRGGDTDALDGIYGGVSKGVYLLAYSILKNGERAKDVMQGTFIRVAANIDKYKPDTNAAAWILTIARNLSYREYNDASRNVALDAADEPDDKNVADLWTQSILLKNAMARLLPNEREIVTLFAAGYKHREIAKIVGRPMGTVQWLYNRAIKKLRVFMNE